MVDIGIVARFIFRGSSLAALALALVAVRPAPAPLHFATAVAVAGEEILVARTGRSARPDAPVSGVHVFQRDARGRWIETAVLAPADIEPPDAFGATLAVDGRRVAVGAPGAADGRGAIYVFERDGTGRWTGRAKLTAASGAAHDSLGLALALRGELLLAGAPGHANGQGLAVVFRQGADAQTWTEQATLPAVNARRFGQALAIADGRLLIGAAGAWVARQKTSGQIVVFRAAAQTWVEETRLTATDTSPVRDFGRVVIAESTTVWVSSPRHGTVYEFRRDTTGQWTETARLRPAVPAKYSAFGRTLARAGRELVIGDPGGDKRAGIVYVFRLDSTGTRWTEAPHLPAPETVAGTPMRLGEVLAAHDDLVVVGVPRASYGEGFAAVYRLERAAGPWQPAGVVADTTWNPWTGAALTGAVIPCTGGQVRGIFDCRNVELLSYLPSAAIGGTTAYPGTPIAQDINDIWGWTDAASGREFALVGRVDGVAFVEVTDPTRPTYLGELLRHDSTRATTWRDIKVYNNYAFVVADAAGEHGMQVFALNQLLNVSNAPVRFTETAWYGGITSAHNLIIDTASGFAYTTGGNQDCGSRMHIIDIRDPEHPAPAGCSTLGAHDAQCVRYHGPDQQYRDREICLHANRKDGLGIVDVTDKARPQTVSIASYPKLQLAHQGWLSDDHRYFFLGDEGDERDGRLTRTLIFDLQVLDDPVLATEFVGTTTATDHNLYLRGSYAYQANYKAGLRVLDIRDPIHPREVGYFDTTPNAAITTAYRGAWSNYPFFKNGVIGISSTDEGLFLVRFRPQ